MKDIRRMSVKEMVDDIEKIFTAAVIVLTAPLWLPIRMVWKVFDNEVKEKADEQ